MNFSRVFSRIFLFSLTFCFLASPALFAAESPAKKITLGAILPLSGENSSVGLEARRGVELATRWMQPEFQKHGYDVQVVFEDDRMDPERGDAALRDLVLKHGVPAIIGPFTSPSIIRLAPLATQSEVALVSGSATSPRIRDLGPWVFSVTTRDDYNGKAISRFAFETLRSHRAAVLYLDNAYGGGLKQMIESEFSRLGGEVVISLGHTEDQTDYREMLNKVKPFQPQCVFVVTYPVMAGLIIKQAREMGWTQPFLGGDGIYSQDLIEVAGPAAHDTYATAVSWRASSSHPESRRFVRGFMRDYQVEPGLYAASYFDAATLVLQAALAQAGKPAPALRDHLRATSFEGVTGTIRFDRQNPVDRPVDIYKVEDYSFDYFFTLMPQ